MSATSYLDTAGRIAGRICRDAIWSGTRCNWLGWSMEPIGGAWIPAYRSFSADLYSGTSGIALFLAQLYDYTRDPIQRSTLEGAVNQSIDAIPGLDPTYRIGFYSGLTGIAYAMTRVGEILEHDRLVKRGVEELAGLRDLPLEDRLVDVIGGSAGAIPVLLYAAKRYKRDDLTEIAATHGKHLLKLAVKTNEGWSWDTMGVPEQGNLTGHSHGVAGIVTAFLELYSATGDRRFKEAALSGLDYERHHFSAEHGNWPDFRRMDPSTPQPPSYVVAWCHGAPGIGLSRLRVRELMEDDGKVTEEINVAVSTTSSQVAYPVMPGQGNYSLCHGTFGNAELLIEAASALDRPDLLTAARAAGDRGIESVERNDMPWPCGIQNAGESPNLMLGLSGIGYYYLRLHDPARVPSVLLVRGVEKAVQNGKAHKPLLQSDLINT